MNTTLLADALALPDPDLLARLPVLAAHERTATADLIAHLAALRLRPSLYAALGYGTLFAYCRGVLRLSEDAAANRIHAVKACLKFPLLLDLLGSGELGLSAIRMLRPHLTAENHERVLARARNARRVDIERLVAELAPRPDVATSVRKLPLPRASGPAGTGAPPERSPAPVADVELPLGLAVGPAHARSASIDSKGEALTGTGVPRGAGNGSLPQIEAASRPAPFDAVGRTATSVSRPVVQPLSPERYRVQFTMGQESYDVLRRLQTLLRRDFPDGDAGAIIERALRVLHERVEAARFGKAPKRETIAGAAGTTAPTSPGGSGAGMAPGTAPYANRIRPGADPGRSRHIPKGVKRAVWFRDRGQCAFVSPSGVRCAEQEFVELHHIQPYALNGPATVANIALRCRRHNAYEAEVVFGARERPSVPIPAT